MGLDPLTDTYATTRATLQRVATHVLARRRAALCAKFGLPRDAGRDRHARVRARPRGRAHLRHAADPGDQR